MKIIFTFCILLVFCNSELIAQSARAIDIVHGAGSSYPFNIVTHKGKIYFVATGDGLGNHAGSPGYEPWISDGTLAGTMMLIDLEPLNGGLYTYSPTNDYIYFSNFSTSSPWRSDGTSSGTIKLSNTIRVNGSITDFFQVGNTVIFEGQTSNFDGELYKTDGTPEGTVLIKDINPSRGGVYGPKKVIGNTLYFSADDGTTGLELWKTDGTESGTVLVKDIFGGLNGTEPKGSRPEELTNVNGTLFFRANSGSSVDRYELWKSNGTSGGTTLVKSFATEGYIHSFTEYNGNLLFKGAVGGTTSLWKSDGTNAGTVLVKTFFPANSVSNMINPTLYNGNLYFGLEVPSQGVELWRTDGTEAGTFMVKDINPGSEDGFYQTGLFAVFNNLLYFNGNDPAHGPELWKTDGTEAGTKLVLDMNPGPAVGVHAAIVVNNDQLIFQAETPEFGDELYVLDETVTATSNKLVESGLSIYPNPSNGNSTIKSTKSGTVNIYHSSGFLVKTEKISQGEDVTLNQRPGTYLVEIINSDGKFIEKLIVY